jgi:large subunit ribosomal protein L21
MYAIVATGGKQYRAEVGDMLDIEKLPGEVGDEITLSEVLLVGGEEGDVRVGSPTLENATVSCNVVKQDRNRKIIVYKSKRRKGYARKQGHRQSYTRIRITAINV